MQHFKHLSLLLLLTLAFTIKGNCQDSLKRNVRSTAKPKLGRPQIIHLTSHTVELPIYVINNKVIPSGATVTYKFLNPNYVDKVDVYQKTDSVAKSYGENGKNGVVLVKYKPGIKLLTLNEILDKFGIERCDQNLRVCIDKTLVESPDGLLFDTSTSFDIKKSVGKYNINGRQINSEEKFINIITATH